MEEKSDEVSGQYSKEHHSLKKNNLRSFALAVSLTTFMPVSVVLIISSFFILQTYRMEDRTRAIQKTEAIIGLASLNLKYILDMETGLRGYLLTGDSVFLEPFNESRKLVVPSLDELEKATEMQESQRKHLANIRSKLEEWLLLADSLRALRSQGKSYDGFKQNIEGKSLIDAIRIDVKAIHDDQYLILQDQQSDSQLVAKELLFIGILISFVLAIGLAGWLRNRLAKQYRKFLDEGERADQLLHRMQAIADAAPVAIVYIDREEKFVFSNSHYSKHFGRENVVGRTIPEVIGPAAYDKIKPYLEKAFKGEITTLESRIARPNRPSLYVKAIYAPSIDAQGNIEGIVAISEDISEKKEAETQLKQSQDGLLFALQSARMGSWEVNLETETISCSQEMLDLWGIPPDDFQNLRENLQSKVHPADLEKMLSAINESIQTGSIYELEYRIIPSPGQERWVNSRGHCTYSQDSERPTRFSGLVHDITERKAREAKNAFLLKSVSAFSKTLTPTEVLETSIHLCSEAFGAKSGFLAVANQDQTQLTLVPGSEGLSLHSNSATMEVFRTGEPKFIHSREEREQLYPQTDNSALEGWVEAFACIPILHRQKITGVLGIAFEDQKVLSEVHQLAFLAMADLVGQALERSQLYEQTQLERDHYRAFFALSSSGSAEIDATTLRPIRINQRFTEITGFSQDELLNTDFLDLIHQAEREDVKSEFEKVKAGIQNVWRTENRFCKKDGSIAWVILSGTVIRNREDIPIRFLVATFDISDLKETEDALKKAIQAREQFLSIASHELRTPLTSLQLQIQLRQRDLKRKDPDAILPEKIEAMFNEQYNYVRSMVHLVDDILDVTKISEGRLKMHFESFDIRNMVHEVLGRFKITADRSQVEVQLSPCQSIEGVWDRFRLEQVLLNLLTNALRYGNKKTIYVELSQNDENVFLIVRDNGMGIKAEDHGRVFERFERAVSENEISGLGLGLYISNDIVHAHGGEIHLKSEFGKGSEFIVVLPKKKVEVL